MKTHETAQITVIPSIETKSASRILSQTPRVLLGVIFFFFGLLGVLSFLGIIPVTRPSTPPPPEAEAFSNALMSTRYMFPLIKTTELAAGILLLSNRFVPLALAILAPVLVNIVAFHAFLAPSGLALALPILGMEVYVAWTYRRAFGPMLEKHAQK